MSAQPPVGATPPPDKGTASPDNDPRSLKQNLGASFKAVIDFIRKSDTANPSVIDLLQSVVDGQDAVFEALSDRFEQLPEATDSGVEPDYSAEDAQGDDNPLVKDHDIGAMILAKALDMPVPRGSDFFLEPTKTSRWKSVVSSMTFDMAKAQEAIANNRGVNFFMFSGMAISALDELLLMIRDIIPEAEAKTWKKIILELRENNPKAARTVKDGKNATLARKLLRKLSECSAHIQERVSFKEKEVSDVTKRVSRLFNRSNNNV